MWELLSEVRARRGTTVIVASHDPSLTEHADRTLHLVDGRWLDRVDQAHGRPRSSRDRAGQPLSSLRHRPGRTFLTALGTALGIATIVALLAVAGGAKQSAGEFVHLGALRPRPVPEGRGRPDDVGPVDQPDPGPAPRRRGSLTRRRCMLLVEDVARSPGAIVFGAEPHGFLTRPPRVQQRAHVQLGPNQIVVGDELAPQLHVAVGDTLTVHRRQLRVVGIYHIGVA